MSGGQDLGGDGGQRQHQHQHQQALPPPPPAQHTRTPGKHKTAVNSPKEAKRRRHASGRTASHAVRQPTASREGQGHAHETENDEAACLIPAVTPRNPQGKQLLQNLLDNLYSYGSLKSRLRVDVAIGEGTFSTVYLARSRDNPREKFAIKQLIPTSSPDRILTEVDCLRITNGERNVVPLLFCHRLLGDVILGMPYIPTVKFSELIKDITFDEMRLYMKHLLRALAHIHKLKIIHRDIKPANFLFDRVQQKFGLVDFGLAQQTGSHEDRPEPEPECKRKLGVRELMGDSSGSPEKRRRCALSNRTSEINRLRVDGNEEQSLNNSKDSNSTSNNSSLLRSPAKTPTYGKYADPHYDYYDRRGSLRKTPTKRPEIRQIPVSSAPPALASASSHQRTPKKNALSRSYVSLNNAQANANPLVKGVPDVSKVLQRHSMTNVAGTANHNHALALSREEYGLRRSPRKHPSSVSRKSTGFSKLTISGSTIMGGPNIKVNNLKKTSSFTMLDPTSGIPSDQTYTPRLASLTSRASINTGSISRYNYTASTSSTSSSHNDASKNRRCDCYGKPQTCDRCLSRRSQKAARAGTPGFRPPEVLLKSEHQTTAIDIWAAGVMMLSLLSRTYPFFRAPDDLAALAEFMVLFGTPRIREVACQLKKKLLTSESCPGKPLRPLCTKLAGRWEFSYSDAASKPLDNLATETAVNLLEKLLTLSPHERITAKEALKHPLFKDIRE